MFKKFLLRVLTIVLSLPIFTHGILPCEAQAKPGSRANLAFLLANSPHADTLLGLFAKNLQSGDYLLVVGEPVQTPWVVQKSKEAKNMMPAGVNIFSAIGFVNIDTLEATVPTLSKDIDWVVYDYEGGPNFSPEFTRDQQASITFFDRGSTVSHHNGFKFMVTPPYGQLRNANWKWGEVAKHMDGIDVQFQAFLKNPGILVPEAAKVVGQIDSLSPNTLTMIQLSLIPTRGTVEDNILAIDSLKREAIDAFLLFYRPTQSDTLQKFFDKFNITAVTNRPESTPEQFVLWQNYPNPFTPLDNHVQQGKGREVVLSNGATIKYALPKDTKVVLKIYNTLGQEIRTLINENQTAGLKSVVWDGRNDFGETVRSGVYIYRIQAGEVVQSKRMLFLR